ncbi:MAG: hypothetical protein WED15_08690 [Akkermansiaceae bacterium]
MIRLLPWKFFVKAAARRYGVLDPATLLARLRRFAQPSEVAEPLELLRAGIIFHARGLVNAKVIQHNLDWVWPYWVERQFNPADKSFIPRAFSFSHINLTHRNWTSVGMPDLDVYPIVDPRGLVTPLYDGWSIDFWIITDGGKKLLPSKLDDDAVRQRLRLDPTLAVTTRCAHEGMELTSETRMIFEPQRSVELAITLDAAADEDGWLAVAIRPYNPEGVQFIDRIELLEGSYGLRVNREATVSFDRAPRALRMARYEEGDVYLDIRGSASHSHISCDVGMATGAALFRLEAGVPQQLEVGVSLERDLKKIAKTAIPGRSWETLLAANSTLRIHDPKMQFLYDAAVHTLLLLSADELVPGPYTYRRFWFRDACLMLHPLLVTGQVERAERILAGFPARQTLGGYFLSQEGEWDSNGQVLWIVARYSALTGRPLGRELEQSLRNGVGWLKKKRVRTHPAPGTHGLLPAGFSAEHLGPNDYYYWDDYWAWAGLEAIAGHWARTGAVAESENAAALAVEYANSIEASIAGIPAARARGGVPAAPGRRMDAGAIGSMVADYPLQIYPPGERRMMKTANYLIDECFSHGGFFQEMIHSGINAYLTLDLAQTLLRAGDPRFAGLIRRVAELATPTGQWPEAIHPQTLGGCMGDGQHGWAAAEWIMMIRNCFVREEGSGLVIGSGILPEWTAGGALVSFGPTLTAWGPVSVSIDHKQLTLEKQFKGSAPAIQVMVPGFVPVEMNPAEDSIALQCL